MRKVLALGAGLAVGLAAVPSSAQTFEPTFYGGSGDQRGTSIAISNGALYVAGQGSSGAQGVVVRYALPPGTPVWSQLAPASATYFQGVAVQDTHVFAAGAAIPPSCGASDGSGGTEAKVGLTRLQTDGTGTACQSANFFGYRGTESFAAAVAQTETGTPYFYLIGSAENCGFGNTLHVLAKYTAGGTLANWVTEQPSPGCIGGSYGNGITALGGSIYVAAHTALFGAGEDNVARPALMKYDASLTRVWKRRSAGIVGVNLAVAAVDGFLYTAGYTFTTGVPNSEDFLVQKYDQDGNLVWSQSSGGGATDVLTGIVGLHGRVFAVGYTRSQGSGGSDAVLLEIDPATGNTRSTALFGGAQDDLANGVVTDGTDLYAVGESRSFATPEGNLVGQNDLVVVRVTVPGCTPAPSGMVSWWSGDGHPLDLAGGNNGTLVNGATYGGGQVGPAFSFDGINDWVQASGTVGDFGGAPFTVDFWMRSNNAGGGIGGTYLVGKSLADGGQGWDVRLEGNRIRVVGVNGWGFNITSDTSATTGVWHHVALSSTVTDVALYVDGVLKGSSPRSTISSTGNPFRIGFTTNYGGDAFSGVIDEVEVFDRALTQPEIQAIHDARSAGKCKPCIAPASGLVSWWPGDGHSLNLAGADNGVAMNGATYSAGTVGEAFALDGVDDHVRVPDNASLDIGSAITLEAWIYPLDPSHAGILAKGAPGTDGVYELALYQGKLHFRLNAALLDMPSISSVPAGAWTHVAGTFDGATARIYINGVLDSSQSYAGPIATDGNPLHIGLYGVGPVYFDGLVDEVAIHDRALSAEEIAVLHAAGGEGRCRSGLPSRTLTVSVTGAGSGTVTAPGIDCGLDCSETYADGTGVSLTATADPASVFAGWSGDCTGAANPFALTMDADKTCTAAFEPPSVTIGTPTKTVSGAFVVGGSVTYTVTVSNTGNSPQPDNPGDELVDVLPASLVLVSASATSGTAAADLGTNTVTWNGVIANGGSVTITIGATVGPTTALGTTVSNQGTIHYDADASGDNESSVLTDDPAEPGASDPTSFVVVSPALGFFTLAPCRVLDTRNPAGTYGGPALAAGGTRVFPLFDQCGIPATARAVSVNLAVTQPPVPGNVRLYPAGSPLPTVSSINYGAGQTRANNAIVTLNGLGELAVYCAQSTGTVHFVLDVNGYFE